MPSTKFAFIEQHHIAPIPADERKGSTKGIFGLWFGVNMLPLTVVTGAVATSVFGLSLEWAILSIVLGNVVGGVFMGLHAAQGPRLGVPQMLQARAQFGFSGASIVTFIAMVMFLGFFASNLVVSADSMHEVLPGFDPNVALVGYAVAATCVALIGYRWITRIVTTSGIIVAIMVLLSYVVVLANIDGVAAMNQGTFTIAGFFGMFAVGAVWQLAYAPYVSDYSRYLPVKTGSRPAFWATYLGCVISAVVVMILGALIGPLAADGNVMGALNEALGGWGIVVLLAFALCAGLGNAANIYSGVLSALSVVDTLFPKIRISASSRIVMTLLYAAAAVFIALAGRDSFLLFFKDFILLLLYALVPWSAINLVDYYLVRHGDYKVADMFRRDGGSYGNWNLAACVSFVIGVMVQLPFMVTTLYTGPLAEQLGFVDIAWVLGLLVSGGIYYAWEKKRTRNNTLQGNRAAFSHVEP
jgi:NCS1 family nucleobase:cation symporter-1